MLHDNSMVYRNYGIGGYGCPSKADSFMNQILDKCQRMFGVTPNTYSFFKLCVPIGCSTQTTATSLPSLNGNGEDLAERLQG